MWLENGAEGVSIKNALTPVLELLCSGLFQVRRCAFVKGAKAFDKLALEHGGLAFASAFASAFALAFAPAFAQGKIPFGHGIA